ncbi:penicillin-binding protein 1A [Solimonas sp. K1W22B-7]|uniref:penicillin-binding protein 1A n=1 Tax=Solimonas sp. K1W22B-7 TaxID=2303331 RepID=UPI000E3345A4|nr:penicillin-binding protein 1A [Solimonas sp. K1W22B-7]AXQ27291.1 penicillin-binding protein 1A [Solimonas sp. K1W22B-7]
MKWKLLLSVLAGLLLAGVLALWGGFLVAKAYFEDELPSVDALRQLQLAIPLRIYSADGKLLGEFGAERRAPLKYREFPPRVVQAFLAAEDDRFFEHPGVDWMGLVRAAFSLAATGQKSQGGSTITMQLARNVFLSNERSYGRKFKEILLSLRIEKELKKEEILELYLNKIYLGERAYGVGAAAMTYFSKNIKDLKISEAAVMAGLPKAPSRDNPIVNPERAKERRNYVLRRMHELGYISAEEFKAGLEEPLIVKPYRARAEVDAYYVAEMVRQEILTRYGDTAYTNGFYVTTTIDSTRQNAANAALRKAINDYGERHGWRGPEAKLDPALLAPGQEQKLVDALDARPQVASLVPVVVLGYSPQKLVLRGRDGDLEMPPEGFKWAAFSAKRTPAIGDVLRIRAGGKEGREWVLAQLPQAQGALVALNPRDGAIVALVGGYDFFQGKFNRVTQARRQAGSGFKPFLYAAAMARGYSPASVFLDAPVVFSIRGQQDWRPENYGGDFKGPMTLREALVQSRNLVSIRVLQAIGIDYAREYIARFGLPIEHMPRNLTMSLGTGDFTPLEMARGFSTIANGGYLTEPYFIDSISDGAGKLLFKAQPKIACYECEELPPPPEMASDDPSANEAEAPPPDIPENGAPRVIDPQTVWMITDILHDVTVRGTAAKVNELGRADLAGKTGTTNDETDAWFNGFQKTLVATAWVGRDQPGPLGKGEVGGRAALPMWLDFMRVALKDVPQGMRPRPSGLVSVRIDSRSGKLASGDGEGVFEVVPQDRIPEAADSPPGLEEEGAKPSSGGVEELF